jgi:hypothetical protein
VRAARAAAGEATLRRLVRIALPVVFAAAGVLALILAHDVRHVRAALAADDARFPTAPAAQLWQPSELFPFDAAKKLLGVGDDVTYRQALRATRLAQPHELVFASPPALALRAEAQLRLGQIAQTDPNASRRSAAENLLGGIAMANSAEDPDSASSLLEDAAAAFRAAVADDPTNDDAKANLELALLRLDRVRAATYPPGNIGNASNGQGAGVGRAGSGY